ncbi:MAG TPA: hypothetical protein VOB72_21775 [Candidatus Dormibacteraeota bacterium]|nr:hypothetical protein [Candidatus Dormibacteraeota bacterium]
MTVLNVLLPLATCLVSLVFAALVLEQWWHRRRPFQAVWGAGLVWYAISSGAQFAGATFGWSPALYRTWYLFGALLVAAYLGMGTVYLLARTGFAHFAGVSIAVGGLFAWLSQLALIREGHPTAWSNVWLVIGVSAAAGVAVIAATAWRRPAGAHVAMGVLGAGSVVVAALAVTAVLRPPGYALDPATHVPVGGAVPGYLRIVTGPFNIAGALCLVFGALFSVYVYMPKRKVLRGSVRTPVLGQLHRASAVVVNLVASVPVALAALAGGRLNPRVPATVLIAVGGFVPSVTSGLERYGVTWSFALGELLGVLLIFAGFLVSEEVLRGGWRVAAWPVFRRPAAGPS